ncbi:hypothetical protein NPS49_05680 [Pseudomonas putida]|uniref:hypothetical protein n=1 Tax=Pseudomonas putida TaxID=303 RepID=UPI00236484C8|nr:hypothetical protein [Pseudomonas putida]MDD2067810.1 hypothetical protein [Pseudomonas putida]HDS1738303.1 hypothetical protein [Pseudomonas putida]
MRAIDREVWRIGANSDLATLQAEMSARLDDYVRNPGFDDLVRITPACIGELPYGALRDALLAESRRAVWYCDHGWHLELRLRLWKYLVRGLQRQLVLSGKGSEALEEDLLAYDVGG